MPYNIRYCIPRLVVCTVCHTHSYLVKNLKKKLEIFIFYIKKQSVSDTGKEILGPNNNLLLSEKKQNNNNTMRLEKIGDINIKKLYFFCVFIFTSSLVLPDLPK